MSTKVNRPTDLKQKDADVNRKLQFYGISAAFGAGKVPSNEQIDIALNSFLTSRALSHPSPKLSTEGKALVADVRDVVSQAKYLLLSRNEGNLLQDFIWQSQKVQGGDATLPGAPVGKDQAKQHGNEALDGLRTLGTLIITNGQFRKLLNDATILIRDIAGDAAQKAANKVNPSEDELSQIDKPADDNVWHDKPNVSTGGIKNQIKSSVPIGKKDLKDAAGDASQNADPNGSRDPADAAGSAGQQSSRGAAQGAQAGASSAASKLKDRANQNISDEDKQKVKDKSAEQKERTRNYLSNKMPDERREQTIWRLKKLVVEIQGHPDYQSAINTLLNLAEEYAGHANTIGANSTGTVKGAHTDDSLKRAESDLKTLVERFANGTSTNDLFDAINMIYSDADKDPELKHWFKSIDKYIRKVLKQQGYIMEDSATDEWNELYDRGNFLLRDRYRNHTDRIVDETKFLAEQFERDPLNKKFGETVQKLFTDLGNDENGKPTFKPHLLKDLTEVILPAAFESIQYVPIPRMEYSDPQFDAVIENLVIESDNLMPNIFEFATDNYFRYGRKQIANKNHNAVTLSVSGIQMDLRDVAYYIKRKQGTPKLTDQGLVDIFLGGTGFSFKIKASTAEKTDKQNFFKIDKVDVDVKNFNIKLKKSKYKLLFGLFKPLMLGFIRPALQKVIEKVIKDKCHELDGMLYKVKIEADRAMEQAKNNPEEAQNIYQRYVTAAQKQFMQGKQKADSAKANTKVNVAMTQHDSIFPNIKLPGGISSKATEWKEMGLKGPGWESPVFKIGSASATKDIPHAPQVRRKEHHVTEGGVRGKQNIGNTGSMTSGNTGGSASGTTGYSSGTTDTTGYSRGTTANTTGVPSGGFSGANGFGTSTGNDNRYGTSTGNDSGYGASNGNGNGFSNQVDQAFGAETTPIDALHGNGTNGYSNGKNTHTGTTLGSHNPVIMGSV
ncbi:Uncharacterized protein LOCC1_G002934 [Lachnellula occidentalis]|uniref:Bactericidal permeability-increasing protein n=1 Tax=Lachnellula occidentalis TaxID=215460 RepID=A0A8H8S6E8_9HELO|nr:Uncharacterized protein LOCC1_G002934 [Lachnellula occidentalis]